MDGYKHRGMVGYTKIDGYKNGSWMDIKKWMVGWIKNRWMVGWMEKIEEKIDGWMDRQDKWMVGCIVKIYEKNSWMVGWKRKLEGWLNGYKKNIAGWLDGQEKIDGWRDGYKKCMDRYLNGRWIKIDGKNRWIEKKQMEQIDGWLNGYTFFLKKIDCWLDGQETIEGWLDGQTNGWQDGYKKQM